MITDEHSAVCTYCGRTKLPDELLAWATWLVLIERETGVVRGFLCPACVTDDDWAEAAIHEATETVEVTPDLRVTLLPKEGLEP